MNDLKRQLTIEIREFFGDRATGFCVNQGTGFHPAIEISFILYNYFEIILTVERNTAFFALRENKLVISIAKTELSKTPEIENLYLGTDIMSNLDSEIRLRIPDKYLKAKGWF